MNCLIYARVSTDRQADKELSIPAQLHACRQYAQQRNWIIIDETIEPGISARTADRPGLRALLGKCRAPDPKIGVVGFQYRSPNLRPRSGWRFKWRHRDSKPSPLCATP